MIQLGTTGHTGSCRRDVHSMSWQQMGGVSALMCPPYTVRSIISTCVPAAPMAASAGCTTLKTTAHSTGQRCSATTQTATALLPPRACLHCAWQTAAALRAPPAAAVLGRTGASCLKSVKAAASQWTRPQCLWVQQHGKSRSTSAVTCTAGTMTRGTVVADSSCTLVQTEPERSWTLCLEA